MKVRGGLFLFQQREGAVPLLVRFQRRARRVCPPSSSICFYFDDEKGLSPSRPFVFHFDDERGGLSPPRPSVSISMMRRGLSAFSSVCFSFRRTNEEGFSPSLLTYCFNDDEKGLSPFSSVWLRTRYDHLLVPFFPL
jgi:hypothetical protein